MTRQLTSQHLTSLCVSWVSSTCQKNGQKGYKLRMPRAARRAFPEVITLYLSELQAQRLRAFAAQSGRDLNSILRDAADCYLDARDAELRARIDAERKERDRADKQRQRAAQPMGQASAPAAPHPPAPFPRRVPTPPLAPNTAVAPSRTSKIPPGILDLVDALPVAERPAARAMLTAAAAAQSADAANFWLALSSATREQSLALLRLMVAQLSTSPARPSTPPTPPPAAPAAPPPAVVVIPDPVMSVIRACPADEQAEAAAMLQVAAASMPADLHPKLWASITDHPIDQAPTRLRNALAELRAMIAAAPSPATGIK